MAVEPKARVRRNRLEKGFLVKVIVYNGGVPQQAS